MKVKPEQIVTGLLIVAAIMFYGPWLLNLFGLINYEPPMSQSPDNVVQIDLQEYERGEFRTLYSFEGDEIGPFMDAFLEMDAKRYANDPPCEYGKFVIRLCYADGGYDLLGGMVEFFSATGESINPKGWYYLRSNDLDELFARYLP